MSISSVEPTQVFKKIYKANAEVFQQCAAFALDGSEQIFNTQCNAWRNLCSSGEEQYLGLFSENPRVPAKLDDKAWKKAIEKNMDNGLQVVKSFLDTADNIQKEFSELIKEQIPSVQRNIEGVFLSNLLPQEQDRQPSQQKVRKTG